MISSCLKDYMIFPKTSIIICSCHDWRVRPADGRTRSWQRVCFGEIWSGRL